MNNPTTTRRMIVPGDTEWPARLADLGEDAPSQLYIEGGGNLAELTLPSVAMVGARAATSYGEQVAHDYGHTFARNHQAVISGAAYGIDGAAHRGALAGGWPTIAVLGCGLDVAYPAGHQGLLRRIVDEGGLVISEYPDDTVPQRRYFLQRNRIIAALARATVVVEAGLRSGSLNTARRAHELGRDVFAVPGPITSAMSQGAHALIRDGQARILAEAPDDVLATS